MEVEQADDLQVDDLQADGFQADVETRASPDQAEESPAVPTVATGSRQEPGTPPPSSGLPSGSSTSPPSSGRSSETPQQEPVGSRQTLEDDSSAEIQQESGESRKSVKAENKSKNKNTTKFKAIPIRSSKRKRLQTGSLEMEIDQSKEVNSNYLNRKKNKLDKENRTFNNRNKPMKTKTSNESSADADQSIKKKVKGFACPYDRCSFTIEIKNFDLEEKKALAKLNKHEDEVHCTPIEHRCYHLLFHDFSEEEVEEEDYENYDLFSELVNEEEDYD